MREVARNERAAKLGLDNVYGYVLKGESVRRKAQETTQEVNQILKLLYARRTDRKF